MDRHLERTIARQVANEELATLWAQALSGSVVMESGAKGRIGLDPATIALLIQILAAVLPKLLERCAPERIHAAASNGSVAYVDRQRLKADIIREIGYWKYIWSGGYRILTSAIRVAADTRSIELMEAHRNEST